MIWQVIPTCRRLGIISLTTKNSCFLIPFSLVFCLLFLTDIDMGEWDYVLRFHFLMVQDVLPGPIPSQDHVGWLINGSSRVLQNNKLVSMWGREWMCLQIPKRGGGGRGECLPRDTGAMSVSTSVPSSRPAPRILLSYMWSVELSIFHLHFTRFLTTSIILPLITLFTRRSLNGLFFSIPLYREYLGR